MTHLPRRVPLPGSQVSQGGGSPSVFCLDMHDFDQRLAGPRYPYHRIEGLAADSRYIMSSAPFRCAIATFNSMIDVEHVICRQASRVNLNDRVFCRSFHCDHVRKPETRGRRGKSPTRYLFA